MLSGIVVIYSKGYYFNRKKKQISFLIFKKHKSVTSVILFDRKTKALLTRVRNLLLNMGALKLLMHLTKYFLLIGLTKLMMLHIYYRLQNLFQIFIPTLLFDHLLFWIQREQTIPFLHSIRIKPSLHF